MKKNQYAFGLLLLLAFACTEQNKTGLISFAPKVTEAKGHLIPRDSVRPKTIPAGIPKTVKAGTPKVKPTNLNVHIAGQPKIIIAGLPKINTPGTGAFALPKIVLAKSKIKPAGVPEVVTAKDGAAKDVNPANFSFYKTLQGLKHSTIRCMLQDKAGNLWFGTDDGGVSRYDGKTFTNFTEKEGLGNNVVFSILEDKTGNLWFGTDGGGVSRYDGKTFTNFTEKEGLGNNVVFSILEDKAGNLWFATDGGGVCRYDGNRVEAIERGEKVPLRDQQGLQKINGKLVKSFTGFTEKEGLGNNVVWSILEDRTGNLWFATDGGGVSRYDGKTFTNFTEKEGLSDNYVISILEDKAGNLWFGTDGGVCRYDGNRVEAIERGEKVPLRDQQDLKKINGKLVKTFTSFTYEEGLGSNVVLSILEDKAGNLWFGTLGGACRYDGNRVEAIERGENIPLRDQQDLQKINGKLVKTFTSFTEKEGLGNDIVSGILEDKTGNLWFGTYGGVCRYDGKSFTNFTEKEGLGANVVLSILEDRTGNLWFGTYFGGVSRYDGKSFTNFTRKEGLNHNFVSSILEDRAGNLWFGINGGGVCRYDGNRVEAIERGENIPLRDQQDLKKINGKLVKSFTSYTEREGLGSNRVLSILEDRNGNLWFGTNGGGACRYDGKSFTNFTEKEGLSNNVVWSILEDKTGNLWFGTNGGACRYDGRHSASSAVGERLGSFTSFTQKEGLGSNVVFSILEDKTGNLWFGTNGGGACRYNGNRVEAIERGEKVSLRDQQDLKKINGKLVKSFTSYTEKEGLSNNVVLSMIQDTEGNIWFGTRKGLSKVTPLHLAKLDEKLALSGVEGKKNYNPLKEAFFYNYGYNDGFLGINCMHNSVLQDSKGRIWWGADVLTCYDPKGDIADTTAPIVNLTSVKLFGEEIAWANLNAVYTDSTGKEIIRGTTNDTLLSNGILLKDIKFDGLTKWYNLPENLSLPYNNNNLTFNFIGVHMQSRNHIKYQYKLEGIDPDWSSITDRTEAPYGNLPGGDYVFKIKAMNQSGVWSEPFEYKFIVRPPWWQTWLFRTIVGLIIVGSVWFYIKWRERKLKAEKEILEKTVEERTAEVVEEKKIVEQKNVLVEAQKVLVEAQKHLIEEKHKEITDSINYAERIQRSFLATKKLLDENLKDHFVFFQPKDVVSGDFYWASKVVGPGEAGSFLLATADSTGHGVPGAIMSILNISSLEKAVEQGLHEPSEILNNTRVNIIERLKNDGSEEGGKDGMDCSLISFNFKANTITYAAANNPIWIVRENNLLEFDPDKMPVGKHDKDSISFTQHIIEIQKGDVIYALTDGMPDQFGGPKGKKFMYKKLKELLINLAQFPMSEQKEMLKSELNNWKGDLEQVDDVCVIGVRV